MEKFQLKETMWLCVRENDLYRDSQQYTRKDSIAKLIEGTNFNWPQCKSFGWRCIKVEVIITELITTP